MTPPSPVLFPLQIILALGNYMNSSKRGAVYGFKLQSLDLVGTPGPPCPGPWGHVGSHTTALTAPPPTPQCSCSSWTPSRRTGR